ncbi:MAG: hypothetical protein QOG91_508 [Candidatus Parcubacteria bacterium]|nr:hypothetical protein [Candidatus Parcubacteria bacterium]
MKINIVAKSGYASRYEERFEETKRLVKSAIGLLPAHWLAIVPPTDFVIMSRMKLTLFPLRRWKSGRSSNRPPPHGWFVGIVAMPRHDPCQIEVFYGTKLGTPFYRKSEEYLFTRALVGALLACAVSQKHIAQLVHATATEHRLLGRHQLEPLFTDDIPAFIVNRAAAATTREHLVHFFEDLDRKILNVQ